jgi:SAM-dependent methyltransferase
MFWDTIKIVTDVVSRLGCEEHLVVINDSSNPCIADYDQVLKAGDQEARYVTLRQRPFEHLNHQYRSLSANSIQDLHRSLAQGETLKGPIVCFDFIESLSDPFSAIRNISEYMESGSYLIINATFAYPYQAGGTDLWRFSPEGLRALISQSGLLVVESDWRLKIDYKSGVINLSTGDPQEIYSCYAVGVKSQILKKTNKKFILPVRFRLNGTEIKEELEQPMVSSDSSLNRMLGDKKTLCLFLNTCYEKFLIDHYKSNPLLHTSDYQTQLNSLNATFFGDSNFYSDNISKYGIDAQDLIINCAPLQKTWANEHGVAHDTSTICFEQIQRINPDIVYIQDMASASAEMLRFLKQRNILIVGQIACEITTDIPFKEFDIVITSFPHYVPMLRQLGVTCYYIPLAFAPQIIEAIPSLQYQQRTIECSFIGGISTYHSKGTQLLEYLCTKTPLQVWGYGAESIPSESALRARHRGEAWGQEMFRLFTQSKITVNRHSEAASSNANNMRLFEATGCGSLLITDYKDNLNELFLLGKEVIAYRSPEECAALINYYIQNPLEAQVIAAAGQKRTLQEHSYLFRMKRTAEILKRHLSYRNNQLPIPSFDSVSTDFIDIKQSDVSTELLEGWKNRNIATSQRGLVQHELGLMYKGQTPTPFQVADTLLKPIIRNNMKVLEVGCSSGYYNEVLEYLLNKTIDYTGADYSEAMITMAKEYYPSSQFKVADGANLPFARESFDVTISGGILIHCPNFQPHISETCRVTKDYILLHRTPINRLGATRLFEKSAYGVKTVEVWFNENELLGCFLKEGFKPINLLVFENDETRGFAGVSYLLRKIFK